jgi:hypothetical protein
MPKGISSRGDILNRTLDGVSLDTIWDEYTQTLSIWNTHRNPYVNLFSNRTTLTGEATTQAITGDDFEEASEFGAPKSIRSQAELTVVGYPLKWYDAAVRYTESFLRDAPASQVQAQHSAALESDNRLVFRETMRALMTQTTLGSRRQNDTGATIYSLWDGEADAIPPEFAGRTFASGHTHYLTSGAATVDGGDLRDLINHITEHGYGVGPGEQIVILVHPNQGETIRGFRVANGAPFDFIPSESAPAFLTTENIVGDKPPAQFLGLEVIGSYGKALVVEDYYMRAGYVVATATGSRSPLAVREHVRPEYQGLRLLPGSSSVPILDSRYSRGFGIGVRNRGAAAVMEITTAATYTSPAF